MTLAAPALETTPPAAEPASAREAWERLSRWIQLYSWAQVVFLLSLIVPLHLFPLLDRPWSCCLVRATGATDWACVAFFHIYEVPLVVFFAYHAWFGFTQVTRARLPYYTVLTLFQVVMLVVFVTFESRTLLDILARPSPTWEVVVVFGGCGGMIVDSVLGVYVAFARLLPACLPEREAS